MKKIMLLLLMFTTCALAQVDDSEDIREYFNVGTATTFLTEMPVTSSDDVFVYKKLITTGAENLLTLDTDYTIAATGGDYLTGYTVTIDPTLGSTYQVVLVRTIKKSQETSQGAITPTSVVTALDRLTRTVQDLQDQSDRSWKLLQSDSETAFDMEIPSLAGRAETFPYFNADGALTYVADLVTNSETASAFGLTIMQSASAAVARGLLGIDTDDAVQFAGITGVTGNFSGSVTLAAGADFIGSGTSDITINTDKFTVAGDTGNTVIAGTLGVTGVATLGDGSVATTQSAGDNSTQIATTEYVDSTSGLVAVTTLDSLGATLLIGETYQAQTDGFLTYTGSNATLVMRITVTVAGATDLGTSAINEWVSITVPVMSGEIFGVEASQTPIASSRFRWRGSGSSAKPIKQ